ncbi:MAG: helix-turn-helix domain-containing protein [Clostridia bacterium]|nr:helix-turn-helix domain-containing protein [Oscillospiraceae bacterium]MBR3272396.1 helix-turn-helix domain-containing protein [Clostridia bacterium]
MIVFEDIMGMLSMRGWSSYRLRNEKILSESIMTRLRSKESITTNTIDKLCELLDCQPGDLMHYVPDEQGE